MGEPAEIDSVPRSFGEVLRLWLEVFEMDE